MAAVSLPLPQSSSTSLRLPSSAANQQQRCKFRLECCNYNRAANGQPGLDFSKPNPSGLSSSSFIDTFPDKGLDVERPPPRPRRIILVRHGESEGNVDETAYTKVPDPQIALTEKGHAEAEACGKRIRELIDKDGVADWQVYFYVSPYRRTLETLRSLAKAFEKQRIAGVREEPRLREQDFGEYMNFLSSVASKWSEI